MGRKKRMEEMDAYNKGYIDASMSKEIIIPSDLIASQSAKSLDYKIEIKCKNKKQKDLLKLLKDETKQICIVHGSAGSGKSYISLAYALSALKDDTNSFEKIIIVVPTLQAVSSALQIGYLKGSLEEKILPSISSDSYTMEKILKNSGNLGAKTIINTLIAEGKIEFRILNHMLGCNIDNSIIIMSEAESFNRDEVLLLLTRSNEQSKLILNGDEAQCCRTDLKKTGSGMKYAIERLAHLDEVAIFEFTDEDIVRNPLIGKILEAWK